MTPDDHQRVGARAARRARERAEGVERILTAVESRLADHKFPTTSEELAAEYGDAPIDLPNETESLGDVFDRMNGEFDSPEAAREAIYGELTDGRGESAEFDPDEGLRWTVEAGNAEPEAEVEENAER